MKYLCLVYQEEKQEVNVRRAQIEQDQRDYWAFTEDIKKRNGETRRPKPTYKRARPSTTRSPRASRRTATTWAGRRCSTRRPRSPYESATARFRRRTARTSRRKSSSAATISSRRRT